MQYQSNYERLKQANLHRPSYDQNRKFGMKKKSDRGWLFCCFLKFALNNTVMFISGGRGHKSRAFCRPANYILYRGGPTVSAQFF